MKVLIATNNAGKVREIEALLAGLPIDLVTPRRLGLSLEVAETGQTYAENAALKATAFARASGLLGLEVDALSGAPGLYSARYSARPGATDADRRAYLLEQLRGKPQPWRARFFCCVAIASPVGDPRFAEGTCPGEIIPVERGQDGFGYDPIFFLPELGRTLAELTMDEKNRLSHRARAVSAAIPILQTAQASASQP
jgi:XTP/dITP diphosphohydrolase